MFYSYFSLIYLISFSRSKKKKEFQNLLFLVSLVQVGIYLWKLGTKEENVKKWWIMKSWSSTTESRENEDILAEFWGRQEEGSKKKKLDSWEIFRKLAAWPTRKDLPET